MALRGCMAAVLALAALAAVLPAAGWGLAVGLPGRLIDSGVEGFEGSEKEMAQAALAKVELNTRDTPSLMVDKSVTRVGKCPGAPTGGHFEAMLSDLVGFSAEVRTYTLFGIPGGRILIPCQGEMRWVPF